MCANVYHSLSLSHNTVLFVVPSLIDRGSSNPPRDLRLRQSAAVHWWRKSNLRDVTLNLAKRLRLVYIPWAQFFDICTPLMKSSLTFSQIKGQCPRKMETHTLESFLKHIEGPTFKYSNKRMTKYRHKFPNMENHNLFQQLFYKTHVKMNNNNK